MRKITYVETPSCESPPRLTEVACNVTFIHVLRPSNQLNKVFFWVLGYSHALDLQKRLRARTELCAPRKNTHALVMNPRRGSGIGTPTSVCIFVYAFAEEEEYADPNRASPCTQPTRSPSPYGGPTYPLNGSKNRGISVARSRYHRAVGVMRSLLDDAFCSRYGKRVDRHTTQNSWALSPACRAQIGELGFRYTHGH